MTVGELRARLQALPDEMPVCVRTPLGHYFCIPVDSLTITDIVHEDGGGYDDPDDDLVLAVPTLVINDD